MKRQTKLTQQHTDKRATQSTACLLHLFWLNNISNTITTTMPRIFFTPLPPLPFHHEEYQLLECRIVINNYVSTRSSGGPPGLNFQSGALRASLTSSFAPFGRSGRVTHADVSMMLVSMMHVSMIHVSMMYVPMIHVSMVHVSVMHIYMMHVSIM